MIEVLKYPKDFNSLTDIIGFECSTTAAGVDSGTRAQVGITFYNNIPYAFPNNTNVFKILNFDFVADDNGVTMPNHFLSNGTAFQLRDSLYLSLQTSPNFVNYKIEKGTDANGHPYIQIFFDKKVYPSSVWVNTCINTTISVNSLNGTPQVAPIVQLKWQLFDEFDNEISGIETSSFINKDSYLITDIDSKYIFKEVLSSNLPKFIGLGVFIHDKKNYIRAKIKAWVVVDSEPTGLAVITPIFTVVGSYFRDTDDFYRTYYQAQVPEVHRFFTDAGYKENGVERNISITEDGIYYLTLWLQWRQGDDLDSSDRFELRVEQYDHNGNPTGANVFLSTNLVDSTGAMYFIRCGLKDLGVVRNPDTCYYVVTVFKKIFDAQGGQDEYEQYSERAYFHLIDENPCKVEIIFKEQKGGWSTFYLKGGERVELEQEFELINTQNTNWGETHFISDGGKTKSESEWSNAHYVSLFDTKYQLLHIQQFLTSSEHYEIINLGGKKRYRKIIVESVNTVVQDPSAYIFAKYRYSNEFANTIYIP